MQKLIKDLDAVFSQYVRLSNTDSHGRCVCVTCGATYHWKAIQNGHFMSRKHLATRWDETNTAPQCKICNEVKGGCPDEFREYLDAKNGPGKADSLVQKAHKTYKPMKFDRRRGKSVGVTRHEEQRISRLGKESRC